MRVVLAGGERRDARHAAENENSRLRIRDRREAVESHGLKGTFTPILEGTGPKGKARRSGPFQSSKSGCLPATTAAATTAAATAATRAEATAAATGTTTAATGTAAASAARDDPALR